MPTALALPLGDAQRQLMKFSASEHMSRVFRLSRTYTRLAAIHVVSGFVLHLVLEFQVVALVLALAEEIEVRTVYRVGNTT